MASRLRILVSGMIAGNPQQGGATWAVLQYLLGLRGLGHDVTFVEPIATNSIVPAGAPLDTSINAQYFQAVATRFDFTTAALLHQDTSETIGLPYAGLVDAARECDLLINISGMLTDPWLLEPIPRRVYLDLDPAFNQLWQAVEGIDRHFDAHTHFATVGCSIGLPGCDVPTCGRQWLPTLQPIALSEWGATPGDADAPWTTVGHWRGYGSICHRGVQYGQKVHSFRRFIDLPRRTRERLRPALSIHPDELNDLDALRANDWNIVDPAVVAMTPDAYRQFIRSSKGELAIAKSGYVESRCGWFSDRSVCYLASGRPVVAQDTGFSPWLPVGEGLLAFTTVEGAVDAIETVSIDYETHCQRAREIAEAHFRAEVVLSAFLERVGATHETADAPPAGARIVGATPSARRTVGKSFRAAAVDRQV